MYEQRSKLLFELDRAAARAAHQKSLADQLTHTANLSEDEVHRLRGLVQDLERKNRMEVQFSNGGLDGKARIPWRPGGKKVFFVFNFRLFDESDHKSSPRWLFWDFFEFSI